MLLSSATLAFHQETPKTRTVSVSHCRFSACVLFKQCVKYRKPVNGEVLAPMSSTLLYNPATQLQVCSLLVSSFAK